jgi:hypothetical protein
VRSGAVALRICEPWKLARDTGYMERDASVADHRDDVKDDASG